MQPQGRIALQRLALRGRIALRMYLTAGKEVLQTYYRLLSHINLWLFDVKLSPFQNLSVFYILIVILFIIVNNENTKMSA